MVIYNIRPLRLLRKDPKFIETFGTEEMNKHKKNVRESSVICHLVIYESFFTIRINEYFINHLFSISFSDFIL